MQCLDTQNLCNMGQRGRCVRTVLSLGLNLSRVSRTELNSCHGKKRRSFTGCCKMLHSHVTWCGFRAQEQPSLSPDSAQRYLAYLRFISAYSYCLPSSHHVGLWIVQSTARYDFFFFWQTVKYPTSCFLLDLLLGFWLEKLLACLSHWLVAVLCVLRVHFLSHITLYTH